MGILDGFKRFLAIGSENTQKEESMSEEKKMTPEEANEYMNEKMLFTPRMFKVINQLNPEGGKTFADFYNSFWKDGALSRKVKELIFMAGGVAYMSPRCIIHVYPAVKAGATVEEVFEAASIGCLLAGFVPNGPGIPYAFEYAVKCVDLAQKIEKGEDWEYLPEPKFDHGVF
ncbi:carboxymuconolactone decarboxylase family protein [bacterium BMS3Bbin06]|nr:carboxymuconolactone decarboxylase family protein [bacterium BMS3Abin08]GBE34282.1 carboxymuconolactone decarboxylase family protein [bacterium BMS3Bbin06]HDH01489.1 carboxymuconolactone decarboxylase family protein [Nitrospirota bacterium]HDO35275.1 carboxymuconolactone decarboxylase family protein [Nitrospirota bacterium]HDY72490.1 carboxymuconolactone decarboxylase family protein [Nitrospirota bacterium]